MMKSLTNLIPLLPLILNIIMMLLMMNFFKTPSLHPLMFLLTLIMITFLISLKMNLTLKSWMPMILFLMMIGGLMVIYMYIISLTNNEFFYINSKQIILNLLKITPLLLIIIYWFMNSYLPYSSDTLNWLKTPMTPMDLNNMNYMYMKFYNKSTIFIMFYLYYSMICIMNICSTLKSPLRQMKKFYV